MRGGGGAFSRALVRGWMFVWGGEEPFGQENTVYYTLLPARGQRSGSLRQRNGYAFGQIGT